MCGGPAGGLCFKSMRHIHMMVLLQLCFDPNTEVTTHTTCEGAEENTMTPPMWHGL